VQKNICSVDDCDRIAAARGMCSRHYGIEYRAGRIQPRSRASEHRLTDVDVVARTATCSICGPTRIRVRNGRGQQCWTLRLREQAKRRQAPDWAEKKRTWASSSREARRAWNSHSVEARREARLRGKYNLSLADYDEMLTMQGGVCAICGSEPIPGQNLHVDHNHMSGKVRALLCAGCNIGLGHLKESRNALLAAIEYLELHSQ